MGAHRTVATRSRDGERGAHREPHVPHPVGSKPLAVVLLVCAVVLISAGTAVRTLEAGAQALLLQLLGMPAQALGQAVIFPLDGRYVGVGFSMGCSVAPLAALFVAGCGIASWARPLQVRSVLLGVGALLLLFTLANQIRIAVIVGMMRSLGFERGYEISHVFLGSAITTVGFVAAVLLFVRLVVRDPVRTT